MSGVCIKRDIIGNVFYSTFTNVFYSGHVFSFFDVFLFFLTNATGRCDTERLSANDATCYETRLDETRRRGSMKRLCLF